MARLTDGRGGTIAKATAPEKGTRFMFDESRDAPKGFGLRITKAGGKAFILRYPAPDGRQRLKTIGPWPTWSLEAARLRAAELRREVDTGGDPLEAVRIKREAAANTFAAMVEQFDARQLSKRRYGPQVRRFLDRFAVPAWGEKPLQAITRRDVLALLDGIVEAGTPVTANRVLAAVRAFFNWCVERDVLDKAPTDGVKAPADETARDRVLSDEEVRWIWKASHKVGFPWGPLARTLLLTGQRLRECAEMTADEIRGETWRVPAARAKNGRAHAVPLSAAVRAELDTLPRKDGSPFMFTTTGKAPVSGFRPGIDRLRKAMADAAAEGRGKPVEIPHWTFHDLRRTAATGMAKLGVPVHVTEAVLNHKSGTISGIAAVYNTHDYAAEKRQALDAWAAHVLTLAGK